MSRMMWVSLISIIAPKSQNCVKKMQKYVLDKPFLLLYNWFCEQRQERVIPCMGKQLKNIESLLLRQKRSNGAFYIMLTCLTLIETLRCLIIFSLILFFLKNTYKTSQLYLLTEKYIYQNVTKTSQILNISSSTFPISSLMQIA